MVKILSILLTIVLQVCLPYLVFANEIDRINLPNGTYNSSTRELTITDNRARLKLSEKEILEMELQRGIGPVLPGNFLYMDKDENDSQTIVGNCKQLTSVTCFFEVTEPEKATDGNILSGRLLVYEIQIINNQESLSINIHKYRHILGRERILFDSLDDELFPSQRNGFQNYKGNNGVK